MSSNSMAGGAGFAEPAALAGSRAPGRERRGLGGVLPLFGPAFVASVAYIDPGNFATNIQGGAAYGYKLLWVVVFANLVAMLFQCLAARIGIATGRNLAELCRAHFPAPVVYGMWLLSEIGAVATELAELLGAGIGFALLLDMPLLVGTILAAAATFALLLLQRCGFRAIEALVAVLAGVVGAAYLIEMFFIRPDWHAVAHHAVIPWLGGPNSVLVAVSIIGATVMPHVIYLHSSLTQNRIVARQPADRARLVRFSNLDVVVALGVAGLINVAMMCMAAAAFHDGIHNAIADISAAYRTLGPLLGNAAAGVFLVSLLASGLSSSVVGTMAGDVIMQGFVGWRIPIWLRRLVTAGPALVIVAMGVDTMRAFTVSQAVLSLVLPLPMLTLIAFASRRSVMGTLAIRPVPMLLAGGAALLILGLNSVLLLQICGVRLPFLP
ncbi:MAG TPA: Nramp family divalent metal transporter [Dongiaceae bacterium]|nr:Nramp family divalent metal transporter [Dongiaceae bacterium]